MILKKVLRKKEQEPLKPSLKKKYYIGGVKDEHREWQFNLLVSKRHKLINSPGENA